MDSLAAECTETARQIRRDKAGALLCQLKWDGERGEYQDAGVAGDTSGGDANTLGGKTPPSPRADDASAWPAVGYDDETVYVTQMSQLRGLRGALLTASMA